MVADLVIAAIVIIFLIIGIRRGFAKTLLNLASVVAASLAANYASVPLGRFLYDSFIRGTVIENLEGLINQYGSEYAAENCFKALPEWLGGTVDFVAKLFGSSSIKLEKSLSASLNAETLAHNIEKPLGNLVVTVISSVLAVIIFIALLFALKRFVVKLAVKIFEIPVLKQINVFFGAVFGIAEGAALSCFAVNIFYAIMKYANPLFLETEWVNGEIFKFLCFFV